MVIKDKVVLITGASSGIGRETAVAFAREGAHVVLAARRKDMIDEILRLLPEGGERHLSLRADITDEHSVQSLVKETVSRFGRIDILINNAGLRHVGLVKDLDMAKVEKVIATNLLGAIRVTREVLPHMLRQADGHIITVSSFLGARGAYLRSVYAASKFGVEGFMESLRSEVSHKGIRISVIRPSTVATDSQASVEIDTHAELPVFDEQTIDKIAMAIVRLAKRPQREYVVGLFSKVTLFVNRLFPSVMDRIIAGDFIKRMNGSRTTKGDAGQD